MKRQPLFLALAGAVALASLTACNGGGNSVGANAVPNAANANVRFVNGAQYQKQAVDVAIDGNVIFHAVAFGSATDFLSIGSGDHSVNIYPAGQDNGTPLVGNQSFHVNGTNYETLAIGGTSQVSFYQVSDQVFNGNYNGNGAVDFYNFAPTAAASGAQFGYYVNPQSGGQNPTITALGQVVPVGNTSGPIGIPTSVALGFGAAQAGSTTAVTTVTPSQISPGNCAANTMACDSGFVSVFLFDGPGMNGRFSGPNT